MKKRFVDFPIGLMAKEVIQSFFQKPVTQIYPFERRPTPEKFRGKLTWDLSRCIGCQLCVKDCPAEALELFTIDRAAKRFVMRFHTDRCTFCGQCVLSCRFKCLELLHDEWELASLNKAHFTVDYGRVEDIVSASMHREETTQP